ncbi:MAG: 30S ribosomal protein S20 [Candidatus Krumholzibacteriia bacterium]|nr:30S ribosomal protein S20 [bacterium]MCB9515152.1 30S ribosomal protein S20 [Candidatus Latescibacterota bacterium]
MPHHKSCKKRLKTAEKSRVYNRAYTSLMRTRLKKFRAIDKADEAAAALPEISAMLDQLAKKGIIKQNRASRLKSRLQLKANALVQS